MSVGLNAAQARAKASQDMIVFNETQEIMKSIISESALGNFEAYVDDGTTEKQVFRMRAFTSGTNSSSSGTFQLIVFLSAGKELRAQSNNTSSSICVSTHQIADINGNLVNPI